jgi:hypothetical protein
VTDVNVRCVDFKESEEENKTLTLFLQISLLSQKDLKFDNYYLLGTRLKELFKRKQICCVCVS